MGQTAKVKTNGKVHELPTRKRKKVEPSEEKPKALSPEEMKRFSGDGDRSNIKPLSLVKPNVWNPNRMTPFQRSSLKVGFETDGWIMSQQLLIWGTDEKGKTKNIIIDGEQRWTVAPDAGFTHGPMVFLHGLTEAQAKALTVKMDQKRGQFDEASLGALLREVQFELGVDNLSLDLGIDDTMLARFLAEPEVVLPGTDLSPSENGSGSGAGPGMPTSTVRMVSLFLNPETHAEFSEAVRKLADVYGTKTVTDTTLEAVRRASAATPNKG